MSKNTIFISILWIQFGNRTPPLFIAILRLLQLGCIYYIIIWYGLKTQSRATLLPPGNNLNGINSGGLWFVHNCVQSVRKGDYFLHCNAFQNWKLFTGPEKRLRSKGLEAVNQWAVCVTVPGKAAGMRFDLQANGIGDQVDQRCGEVQIDGSVEILLQRCSRRGQEHGGDGFKVGWLAATWSFGKHTVVALHLICNSGDFSIPRDPETSKCKTHAYDNISINIVTTYFRTWLTNILF